MKRSRSRKDADNPVWTEAEFAKAKPAREALPELVEAFERSRGRPKLANAKERVSLRLDPEVLAKLKSSGPGWQGRVAELLRKEADRLTAKPRKPAKRISA